MVQVYWFGPIKGRLIYVIEVQWSFSVMYYVMNDFYVYDIYDFSLYIIPNGSSCSDNDQQESIDQRSPFN